MIVFRNADSRFPFLWEDDRQPSARWHGPGEGPVAYLAETPDGAWAEFLRHEEIDDPSDVAGVARAMWCIELRGVPRAKPRLPVSIMTGDVTSYPECQAEARRLRSRGARGLVAPSAALLQGTPSGFTTDGDLMPARPRAERVFVLFGARPDLVGWAACDVGRPRGELVLRVRPLAPAREKVRRPRDGRGTRAGSGRRA